MEVIERVKLTCPDDQFETAVDILVRKPHSIIKKLAGCTLMKDEKQSSSTGCEELDYSVSWESKRKLVVKGGECVYDRVTWKKMIDSEKESAVEFIVGQSAPDFIPCSYGIRKTNGEITFLAFKNNSKLFS